MLAQWERSSYLLRLLTPLLTGLASKCSRAGHSGWLRCPYLPCHVTPAMSHPHTPHPPTHPTPPSAPLPPCFSSSFYLLPFYIFSPPPQKKEKKKKEKKKKKEIKISCTRLKVAGAILPETKNFSERLEKLSITSSLM